MAIVPVSRLIRPLTRDDVMSDMIELGNVLKLRTSSWRGPMRWLLIAVSEIGWRSSVQIAAIAAGGYNQTAWGYMLRNLSESQFQNIEVGSTRAFGLLTAEDVGEVGPVTWPAGSRVFSPRGPLSPFKFVNAEEVTVPYGGSIEFTVYSQLGGVGYNDVPEDEEWDLNPVQAGIEITNPENDTGIAGNWLTQLGTDAETDALMRTRNRSKWATLGGNAPSAAYVFWATTATDGDGLPVGITRALVPEPPGDGTLTVYVATAVGAPTVGQISDVQDYIDARHPITAVPTVIAVTTVSVTVSVTVTMLAGTPVLELDVSTVINDVINETPIGGTLDGSGGNLILSEIVRRVKNLDPDVVNVVITSPGADVAIEADEIAIGGSHVVSLVEI